MIHFRITNLAQMKIVLHNKYALAWRNTASYAANLNNIQLVKVLGQTLGLFEIVMKNLLFIFSSWRYTVLLFMKININRSDVSLLLKSKFINIFVEISLIHTIITTILMILWFALLHFAVRNLPVRTRMTRIEKQFLRNIFV